MYTITINGDEWVELSLAVEAALRNKFIEPQERKILEELVKKVNDAPKKGMMMA